jgi:hypothetical protein
LLSPQGQHSSCAQLHTNNEMDDVDWHWACA